MNLKQLEYFVRVAELGSFSKAAMVLNIAQPALSRQVRLLETELHVTLLIRNGRGVVLTEVGNRLFKHSIGILQLAEHAIQDIEAARNEPFGRITLGLPPSMSRRLTPSLVDAFCRVLPKARLSIVEGLSTHLIEWIATGRVDLGLVYNAESNLALDVAPVLDESLGLVSLARRDDRKAKTVPFFRLPEYPLILPQRGHALRKLIETQAALAGLKLNIAFEVSGIPSILDLVAAGYGHAVLTQASIAASNQPQTFILRPFEAPSLSSTLSLATSARKPVTPLIRQAAGLLRQLITHKKLL